MSEGCKAGWELCRSGRRVPSSPPLGGREGGGGLRDRGGRGWREGREAALLRGLPGRLPPPPPLLLLPAAGPLRGETLESH